MTTVEIKNLILEVPSSEFSYSLKHFLLRRRKKLIYSKILEVENFVAKMGDKICVVGRNGQGKTTFMKIIAGIYFPTKGEVQLSSTPTTVLAAGIGLEDELSVIQNTKLALTIRGIPLNQQQQMINEILDFCELTDSYNKLYKHLSTGFKSRLAFAIAISEEPKILILDEVLGGGDEFFMKKAEKKLNECILNSQTAFIATHGPDDFKDICNRLIIIENGHIFYDGNFDDGLQIYRDKYK